MFRLIVCTLFGLVLGVQALAAPGDADVLRAHQAWSEKKSAALMQAARSVPASHPAQPYVEYWQLTLSPRSDERRIVDYLARHDSSRTAELLRGDWLKTLGARGDWARYLAEYPRLERPDLAHRCYMHRAEWARGDRRLARDAALLWPTGRDLPGACSPLFDTLFEAGVLTEEDRWRRIRLAFESGNPGVARSVAGGLPAAQRPAAVLYDRATREPERVLQLTLDPASRGEREIALYALDRLARESTPAALGALDRWLPRLTEEERRSAWARVASWQARRHDPDALASFAKATLAGVTDAQREWWVRAALRVGDWASVARVIDSMDIDVRALPSWRYWRARAAIAQGQRALATPLLLGLSREHGYYGQLAQEELGTVAGMPPMPAKRSAEDLMVVSRHPGIERALVLYRLGLRREAHAEWNWSIRNFSDEQLLAAAELARRAEWYDRAIHTAERTRDLHDFELRFIAPYRELAQQASRDYGLDEAWVFGLMRQESRFINVARSGVGATGLMQIMPATAQWIARRLGVQRFKPRDIEDPATNIRFGAYYLRHVQDTLDGSPVLASAAYNAGPSRAQRWRDTRPMEAAIYIETIPFAETRDYVKKVMSNALVYAVRFGQPSVLLKDRLGVVPPRPAAAPRGNAISLEPGADAD